MTYTYIYIHAYIYIYAYIHYIHIYIYVYILFIAHLRCWGWDAPVEADTDLGVPDPLFMASQERRKDGCHHCCGGLTLETHWI